MTHFDLANNYGPPYGSAEETFGRVLHDDLRPYRDELVLSTKAGYDMWPARTAKEGRASTCSHRSTSRWRECSSTTSTSSTHTASIPRRRSKRRWARSTRPCARFPAEYQGDIFASEHGSWNKSVRVGYEVIRVPLHQTGHATGEYEDFMTGFVVDNDHVWGRPTGITVAPDGSLLVTDDASGSIWRIVYTGS